jgi:hypothetical protein
MTVTRLGRVQTGSTMSAMNQMKPTRSQAMVVTTLPGIWGATPCRLPSGGDSVRGA